ncbi:single-pass membrane and coiled-coil domain-containing protein 2 [Trichechus manatus latirostris]|uniref:Single-pass membrane and coiled-coil domain-containing protein 2 n=1 Tax=Trichechus manatus latirostris TaxID=127582 RepID=A0A2Y9RF02_TRIMA|nr:single-pass membrane and coiled-coil domain-containing protein 2 [Trichechus manatus latirostris]
MAAQVHSEDSFSKRGETGAGLQRGEVTMQRQSLKIAEDVALTLTNLNDKKSLQMKTVWDERQQLTENDSFLQNTNAAEGAMLNLQSKITKMDYILDRSDDEDNIFSENPQNDFLHQDMLQMEAEQDQNLQHEQNEQETAHIQHEDPQMPTSLQFSEENISVLSQENMVFKLNHWNGKMDVQVKELNHIGWMEKINNIIRKINVTKSTMKSLLSEMLSLEGQIEKLDSHQDLYPNQGANTEADACNEAHELKEKLLERVENFSKAITLMNRNQGEYQMQEQKTDSPSPREMEPLLPQAPSPPLVENSPPRPTEWKHALRIFILFCILTFIGLSCYILFFDPTFIFERMLPKMLGRQRMWELREIIAPFLNLEVEDLLPS